MNIYLLFVLYFILAASVIFVTSKASAHIDEIDAKTNLGSAVLGGILLAAVTSLPELVTSTVSSLGIGMDSPTPGLAIGNILGSNIFNMMILGIADLVFIKRMYLNKVDKANRKSNMFVCILYGIIIIPVILFNFILGQTTITLITNLSFSILSIFMIGVYLINVFTSKNNDEQEEEKEVQPIKNNIIFFTLWSILIVLISVCITLVTDNINTTMGLDASFAGAIFLGIATSLPELTAVITLVKLKNYASAIGNVVGSSLFNLVILSFVDIITPVNLFQSLFQNTSSATFISTNEINLLILGAFSVLILMYTFKRKEIIIEEDNKNKVVKKLLYILPSIMLIGNYVLYLVLSIN